MTATKKQMCAAVLLILATVVRLPITALAIPLAYLADVITLLVRLIYRIGDAPVRGACCLARRVGFEVPLSITSTLEPHSAETEVVRPDPEQLAEAARELGLIAARKGAEQVSVN